MSTDGRKEIAEAQKLAEREDIKTALSQTVSKAAPTPPRAQKRDKLWFGAYGLVLLALVGLDTALDMGLFFFIPQYVARLERLTLGAILVVVLLAIWKGLEIYLIGRITHSSSRYTVTRIARLFAWLILGFIILSVLFDNWYTAVFSLGLISIVLGLSLQSTFTSFVGWIYILVRQPYRVGDRIKIGEAKGDVIGVGYLDTTLWEFGGPYLSTDHPSGRIIRFPNSEVFRSAVYNYSWALFPYVWQEIKFYIAYESDLEFVAKVMQEVAEEEMGEFMMERVRVYRELLARTPVDELQINERPVVHFRVSDNTWLEAIVRYLVHPKNSGRVKTRLIQKLLARLNAEPARVLFPKSNLR